MRVAIRIENLFKHCLLSSAARLESYGLTPYDAEIDPTALMFVDPMAIERFSFRIRPGDVRRVEAAIGDVRAGNWDRTPRNVYPHQPE